MWGRRRETQAEAADAAVSAAALAGGTAPETEGSPSSAAETLGLGSGDQHTPAAEQTTNGGAVEATTPILDEKTQAFWRGKLAAANLANAVALFMRSPAHRHYTLADLEWCLLPALARSQFMVAEAKLPNGQVEPAMEI